MEDPTGGMWIYLIFLIIPLARIIPRMLRKYRNKGLGSGPDEQHSQEGFFSRKLIPERPRFREEEPPERPRFREREPPEPPRFREEEPPEPQPKPDKKDGWVGKDDFN